MTSSSGSVNQVSGTRRTLQKTRVCTDLHCRSSRSTRPASSFPRPSSWQAALKAFCVKPRMARAASSRRFRWSCSRATPPVYRPIGRTVAHGDEQRPTLSNKVAQTQMNVHTVPMRSNKSPGRRIQVHREELGMSPEAFGRSVGVSGLTIRDLERDARHPQDYTAFLIAKAMGLSKRDLWPEKPKKTKTKRAQVTA